DGRWRREGDRVLLQEGPLWPRKEQTTLSDNITSPTAAKPTAPGSPVATDHGSSSQTASTQMAPSSDNRISIDDFMKVELRVAKVLAAERVPKSKKLLKLQVDVGTEHRTLVAGIADAYEADALVGRTVVVVFNLQPATLMGIQSNGMVL